MKHALSNFGLKPGSVRPAFVELPGRKRKELAGKVAQAHL